MKTFFKKSSAMGLVAAVSLMVTTTEAATINFTTDPFAGSDALTTPGRQVVGGELFVNFSVATDSFAFDPSVFGISAINVANAEASLLPTSGANVIVLQTFDNDANAATPFGAGNAATLIADRITSSGAGFFIYFNSGLDIPRLVYSTDLSDGQADLKVLARLTNLSGATGRASIPSFTAANFQIGGSTTTVPDSASHVTVLLAVAGLLFARRVVGRYNQ